MCIFNVCLFVLAAGDSTWDSAADLLASSLPLYGHVGLSAVTCVSAVLPVPIWVLCREIPNQKSRPDRDVTSGGRSHYDGFHTLSC